MGENKTRIDRNTFLRTSIAAAANWGFLLLSKSGRLYVVYNQYQGIHDYHHQVTGTMDCVYCDDFGRTWSKPSDDDGETWRAPRPLLRKDHGKPILQPIFCRPIYQMSDGRYLLVHHPEFNGIGPLNRVDIGGYTSFTTRGGKNVLWHPERKFFLPYFPNARFGIL